MSIVCVKGKGLMIPYAARFVVFLGCPSYELNKPNEFKEGGRRSLFGQ